MEQRNRNRVDRVALEALPYATEPIGEGSAAENSVERFVGEG